MSISVQEVLMEKADEQPPADVPSVPSAEDLSAEGKDPVAAEKEAGPQRSLKTT